MAAAPPHMLAGKEGLPMTELSPPRRAGLYIRVSTEEQAKKGCSLAAQREDLERCARELGYTVAGVYIDGSSIIGPSQKVL